MSTMPVVVSLRRIQTIHKVMALNKWQVCYVKLSLLWYMCTLSITCEGTQTHSARCEKSSCSRYIPLQKQQIKYTVLKIEITRMSTC